MGFKNFCYTLKVCGLRWFTLFLPIFIIIGLMQEFGSQEKFNDKFVNAVRLGNSGVFIIYSEEIEEKIRVNMKKNKKLEESWEMEKLKEDYKKAFGSKNE